MQYGNHVAWQKFPIMAMEPSQIAFKHLQVFHRFFTLLSNANNPTRVLPDDESQGAFETRAATVGRPETSIVSESSLLLLLVPKRNNCVIFIFLRSARS